MREIGQLTSQPQAETFQNYLLTQGVKSRVDQEAGGWTVWVYDEDDVSRAKEELARFVENGDDEAYRAASRTAAELRKQEQQQNRQTRKKQVNVRERWERPLPQACPVTYTLIGLSLLVVAATSSFQDLWNLCDRTEPVLTKLFIAPMFEADAGRKWYPGLGLQAVWSGEVWRLVTPIFIHFSLLHILFNMLWLRDLGTAIEFRRGSRRFLALVLAIAVISNVAQYLLSGPAFGGMSGVVFGLFGYIWIKSRYEPEAGFFLHPNTVFWVMAWFFLCMTGTVGAIANAAHSGGLIVGVLVAYAPIFWRKATR